MRVPESLEPVLEQLWNRDEEGAAAQSVEVRPEEITELVTQGLAARVAGNGTLVRLTDAGRTEAARAVRRHRLAERLLADMFATDEAQVHARACQLQHALLDGLDDTVCTLLGHPRFCPHGRPIPRGDCCRLMRSSVGRVIAPLCDLQPGESGRIAYLHMNDPRRLEKLIAMGVLPGVPIRLVRRYPSVTFEAGYSQFAVDEETAADLYVRLSGK